jgi:hypothetical protein
MAAAGPLVSGPAVPPLGCTCWLPPLVAALLPLVLVAAQELSYVSDPYVPQA